jgi:hypothetical protein
MDGRIKAGEYAYIRLDKREIVIKASMRKAEKQ